MAKRDPVFTAEEREKKGLETFSHPLNPGRSEMRTISLSDAVGLQRIGVHLAYHTHLREEEWLFVLSGRGRMEVDGKMRELGPGDFCGFVTPSVPHQLSNPHGDDLVYLTGGERTSIEVAEFPRLRKLMVRTGMEAKLYPLEPEPFRAYVGDDPDEA